MQDVLVSIIVPYFNQSEFIEECLDSVLAQTYSQWECIIVNDGSPDNIEQLLQNYLNKDTRFKYIKIQNSGLSSARNTGIKISSGKYILPLDADDKISFDYCKEAIEVLEINSKVKVVYAEAELFGIQRGLLQLAPYSIFNLSCKNVIYCSAFFRKTDYEEIGGYDEDLKYGLEDWDFWISLLKNGGDVIKLPRIHFYYRIKKESMLATFIKSNEEQFNTMQHIYSKHEKFFLKYHGSPILVIQKNQMLEAQVKLLNKNFYHSRKYKLGNMILSPLNVLKNLTQRRRTSNES